MFPGTKLSPDLLALVLALFELRPCRPASIGKERVRSAIASLNTREVHREAIPEIACSQETVKYMDEKTMASRPPENE
jgi:hypothetical protein